MSFFSSRSPKIPLPEFIAIGDVVIDAFIRLNDTNAHIVENPSTSTREISMNYGDKIPFDFSEELPGVGNSANAAVSAARLGLTSALIANAGEDRHGQECTEQLKSENVQTQFIMTHKGLKTNYHYVLWYKDERTILIKHELFPLKMPDIGSPKWFYLSSLGENSLEFHEILADYLDKHPNINLIFQPGTYQMKFGTTALKRLYKRSKLFFCNLEEAQRILGIQTREVRRLLGGLQTLGPILPVITDGPKGAYTLIDKRVVFMPSYPDPKPPYERTGAGDAFASSFSVAIALGQTIETALKWGSINSMSVVQYVGAQKGLLRRAALEKILATAPESWKLQVLE
ncbi:MAG: carbohydrate kinase family protein [Patescibacteria group bacterium]